MFGSEHLPARAPLVNRARAAKVGAPASIARPAMAYDHPENLRVYGILLRNGRVLVAAEYVAEVFCWKFPGGGVKADESAEDALRREYREETGLEIEIGALLHAPGTLFSPWSRANYTPMYWRIAADGEPVVPAHEPVEIGFKDPAEIIASDIVADPEKVALKLALAGAKERGD